MLASEPFRWLLKDAYPSHSELAEKRRNGLIDIFRKAVKLFKSCETWLNGQPVLRGITELGGVFRDSTEESTDIIASEVIPVYIPEVNLGERSESGAKSEEEEEDLDNLEEEDKLGEADEECMEEKSD
ncbi:hypothetical protein BJY01DRAFT_249223 [Aspergillus pseudoustus]|uniref:Uncharacterized protein n=1 Tax=Aspergillus pseudoustus TaxID=1810923 RepID=A0ABR4JQ69_9EURO